MARLTNEEIRRMTIDQADAYTDAHPAEAWRFVKVYGAAAAQQTKKAVKHGLRKGMLVPEPEVIELAWQHTTALDCSQQPGAVPFWPNTIPTQILLYFGSLPIV